MEPITASAVEYVCWHMRAVDAEEVYGLRAHDNPMWLCREVVFASSLGKAAVAFHGGRPCAVIGVSPKAWPGVWDAWCFGTENLPAKALDLTRYAVRVLKPFVLGRGAHRLEAASRIDHAEAHSWLRALGARDEGVLRGYGRDGADYVMFGWTRNDHVHFPETAFSEAGSSASQSR
jgi:hypothetical protein